jgi:hypothetical protein
MRSSKKDLEAMQSPTDVLMKLSRVLSASTEPMTADSISAKSRRNLGEISAKSRRNLGEMENKD